MSRFNTEKLLFLYSAVQNNGSLEALVSDELSYDAIAQKLGELILIGNLEYKENHLTITESGKEEIKRLKLTSKRLYTGWIEPLVNERIDRLSKDEIYLPPKSLFK